MRRLKENRYAFEIRNKIHRVLCKGFRGLGLSADLSRGAAVETGPYYKPTCANRYEYGKSGLAYFGMRNDQYVFYVYYLAAVSSETHVLLLCGE